MTAALGGTGVAGKKHLQGLALGARLRAERLYSRGRRRVARHPPALRLREPPRAIEHRVLAGLGVAPDADGTGNDADAYAGGVARLVENWRTGVNC